jgi:hypothetical protein
MNRRILLLGGAALCASALVTASGASAMFGNYPSYDPRKWRSKHDYDRDREAYLRDCCEGYKPVSKGHGGYDYECDKYYQHKTYGGSWWWW